MSNPMGDPSGPGSTRCAPEAADASSPSVTIPIAHPSAAKPRDKATHVGAPAIFALEQACQQINRAFGGFGCYLVGSSIARPDWRDVDVRFIMGDEEFSALFPDAGQHWEFDARWLIMTISISERLSKVTGLPIDFQFQPQTHANKVHKGARHALGLIFAEPKP